MTATLWQATRVVHRYCGRQHGGHCEVARSEALSTQVEPLVHRRSDLAGEDLGHPVPPYFSGYPLPDGRYAFARTRYLEDADCLGAVRTESLILTAEQQAELAHPLLLAPAFDEPADLGAELQAVRAASGPHDVPPRDLSAWVANPAPRFPQLLALDDTQLAPLLDAYCGPLPVAIVGGTLELLAELLLLAPNPWAFGLCTQALSHRDWARVQTVPAEASERFVLRAARDKDVAVVDLARASQASASAPLASWIHARLRAGELDELLGLVRRARRVGAYAVPADLAAQQRFEVLDGRERAPEEVIEHANHLKVRGAAPEVVAEAFTPLLGPAPDGRAGFTLNVLRNNWLPAAPDPDAQQAALGALLEQAASEGQGRALEAFLEAAGERAPRTRERGLRTVVQRLNDPAPWPERADAAWRDLAQVALPVDPEAVTAALAERAPWFSESELDRALTALGQLGDASDASWLQAVDAAAATASASFAAAVRAADARPSLRQELALRVSARAPQDPSLIGELTAEWDFPELAHLLRGLTPAAWSTAAEVLRERVDTLERWDAGGGRALARLAAHGRADPDRRGLARQHALHLFRAHGARQRLLDLARRKAAAGAREVLLATLHALRSEGPPPVEEREAWQAVLAELALPLDDRLASLLPAAAWSLELTQLAPRVGAPPLEEGPLAERMQAVAARAAASYLASPGPADPACAPWLALALASTDDTPEHWLPAVAALWPQLEAGPAQERLRAATLARRDTLGPEALPALRELVPALGAPELAQGQLEHELSLALRPEGERALAPLEAEGWRRLLGLASSAPGSSELWARVGAAVGAGALDLTELRALAALPLAQALDALGGGFSLRIQNGLQRLALTLADGDDPDRLAVTIRAVLGRSKGDRELRQRLGGQLQAALEAAPALRTPSVFDALRALLK